MPRSRVKITVLKRVEPSVIFGSDVPIVPGTDRKFEICSRFREDQEFIVEEDGNKPEGFCGWAWRDVYKDLSVLQFGGNLPWTEEGTTITCCTDGIRPVSFKLERLEN